MTASWVAAKRRRVGLWFVGVLWAAVFAWLIVFIPGLLAPSAPASSVEAYGANPGKGLVVKTSAGGSYQLPAACQRHVLAGPQALDLAYMAPGLHKQIDSDYYYQVFGFNRQQLESQLLSCEPVIAGASGFAGQTVYIIDWSYLHELNGQGRCQLTNVKVGLHVRTYLPSWQTDNRADQNLVSQWQRFMTALKGHEQLHAQYDATYATQMYQDLTNLSTPDCSTISLAARSTVSQQLAALNQANNDYDARTNHGATQGAIIP